MRRLAGVLTVALIVAACAGSGVETVAPSPSAGPTDVTPTVAPTPTADPSPGPTEEPEPEPRWAPGEFPTDLAMEVVRDLSGDIGPRPAGSAADARTREYLADRFREAGWTVSIETFDLPQGGQSGNVIATPPRFSLDEPHTVVGAHHDTVADSPGANDNATGIGALLALATSLGGPDQQAAGPVVLVAFGAEEFQPSEPREHHLGSQDYVERHGSSVTEMLSIDMVGHAHPSVTCICYLRDTSDQLATELAQLADAVALGDEFRVEARGDISDHGPFALAGIPAAFLWSFDDGVKHTPADTADLLHDEDVERAGRLVLRWLLAEAD